MILLTLCLILIAVLNNTTINKHMILFTYSQPQLLKLKLKFLQSMGVKLLDLTVYRRTYLHF